MADARVSLGLYGKIPAEGDFFRRALPTAFVQAWDGWLSRGLVASQGAIQENWAQAYLLSPPWRFILEPGLIGPGAWTGVLLSSIDKVNRFFPLTIVLPLDAVRSGLDLAPELRACHSAMESAAFALIDGVRSVDDVLSEVQPIVDGHVAVLRARQGRRFAWARQGGDAAWVGIGAETEVPPLPGIEAAADRQGGAFSYWWHEFWEPHPPTSVLCRLLPPAEGFAAFLDGRWGEHGWAERSGPAAA